MQFQKYGTHTTRTHTTENILQRLIIAKMIKSRQVTYISAPSPRIAPASCGTSTWGLALYGGRDTQDSMGAAASSRKPGPWPPPSASSPSGSNGAFVVSGAAADRTLQRWAFLASGLWRRHRKRDPSDLARKLSRQRYMKFNVDGNNKDGDGGLRRRRRGG